MSVSSKKSKSSKGKQEKKTESGSFSFPDGSVYNGEFVTGADGVKARKGKGTYTSAAESYNGTWDNDKQDGQGVYKFNSGAVYKGSFSGGCFHGQGLYTFADGACYNGMWSMNKMHGSGVYVDAQKIQYKGSFFNGMFDSGKSFVSVRP